MRQTLLIGITLLGVSACQTTGASQSEDAWISALKGADVVILGETHDNPYHHQKQAEIISEIKPDFVVFEMVPSAKTDRTNEARRSGEDIGEALSWDESGWPDFELYRPVFDASRNATIIGAGMDRSRVRQSMTDGAQSVSGLPEIYGLSDPLPDDQIAVLTQEFIDSHCRMIPAEMATSMIEAQRLRDAVFASHVIEAHQKSSETAPVVLIAGSGHARKDRGVPLYLRHVDPELDVIVLGLIEAGTQSTPELYDYTLSTPSITREDPCNAF